MFNRRTGMFTSKSIGLGCLCPRMNKWSLVPHNSHKITNNQANTQPKLSNYQIYYILAIMINKSKLSPNNNNRILQIIYPR